MTWSMFVRPTVCALVLALSSAATQAAPEPTEPERLGEIHITLKNAEYVKFTVNDNEWAGHEFERGGKRLLIKNLPLDQVGRYELVMTPVEDTLGSATLVFEDKQFHKRRKGRVIHFIATGSVTFPAQKAGQPAPTPKPDEPPAPTPKPDDDDDDDEL